MTASDEQAYYPEELITAVKRFIQKALFQSILKVPFGAEVSFLKLLEFLETKKIVINN
jgi:hypothetical protein